MARGTAQCVRTSALTVTLRARMYLLLLTAWLLHAAVHTAWPSRPLDPLCSSFTFTQHSCAAPPTRRGGVVDPMLDPSCVMLRDAHAACMGLCRRALTPRCMHVVIEREEGLCRCVVRSRRASSGRAGLCASRERLDGFGPVHVAHHVLNLILVTAAMRGSSRKK